MAGARTLAALVLLATAACGGERETEPARGPAGAAPDHVTGLVWQGRRAQLARLDPITLRPVDRRRTAVVPSWTAASSPDGGELALGSAERAVLTFVDAETLRVAGGPLPLVDGHWIGQLLWPRRDRILVFAGGEDAYVVTVDPVARRVVAEASVDGVVVAHAAAARRIVLLLAPRDRIGPSRLAVVDLARGARTVALPGVLAGSERIEHESDTHAIRQRVPGLAVSPRGDRAVVVGPGSLAVEIDLDSLTVRERELSEPVSLLGRLRNWLEPPARAKVVEGPHRSALWLGEHHVAVTGIDYHGLKNGEWDARPAGLRIVDTRDWSIRTVAERVTSIVAAGDLVLAFGGNWPEGSRGTGLRAYGPNAEERFHVFDDAPIGWVETAWPYGYVARPRSEGHRSVVDLRSGRAIGRTAESRTVTVLDPR
jgi:hypothetical protein